MRRYLEETRQLLEGENVLNSRVEALSASKEALERVRAMRRRMEDVKDDDFRWGRASVDTSSAERLRNHLEQTWSAVEASVGASEVLAGIRSEAKGSGASGVGGALGLPGADGALWVGSVLARAITHISLAGVEVDVACGAKACKMWPGSHDWYQHGVEKAEDVVEVEDDDDDAEAMLREFGIDLDLSSGGEEQEETESPLKTQEDTPKKHQNGEKVWVRIVLEEKVVVRILLRFDGVILGVGVGLEESGGEKPGFVERVCFGGEIRRPTPEKKRDNISFGWSEDVSVLWSSILAKSLGADVRDICAQNGVGINPFEADKVSWIGPVGKDGSAQTSTSTFLELSTCASVSLRSVLLSLVRSPLDLLLLSSPVVPLESHESMEWSGFAVTALVPPLPTTPLPDRSISLLNSTTSSPLFSLPPHLPRETVHGLFDVGSPAVPHIVYLPHSKSLSLLFPSTALFPEPASPILSSSISKFLANLPDQVTVSLPTLGTVLLTKQSTSPALHLTTLPPSTVKTSITDVTLRHWGDGGHGYALVPLQKSPSQQTFVLPSLIHPSSIPIYIISPSSSPPTPLHPFLSTTTSHLQALHHDLLPSLRTAFLLSSISRTPHLIYLSSPSSPETPPPPPPPPPPPKNTTITITTPSPTTIHLQESHKSPITISCNHHSSTITPPQKTESLLPAIIHMQS